MNGMTVTANDVVKIIKACKHAKVTRLKLGELDVEFDTNFHPNKSLSNAAHTDVIGELIGQPPGLSTSQDNSQPDQLELDANLDQLAIEDPEMFEQLQIRSFNQG